jgi:hypothetical protein
MPITFDTLDELKAFYRTFRLEEKGGNGMTVHPARKSAGESAEETGTRGRRGRKPGSATPGKRGPKPKYAMVSKAEARKSAEPKGETLTSKIRATIQKFLDADNSFTANDIYDDLVKRDDTVNKQSVITSVLKQMNSTFKTIAVTERPGNGPRPVKLYNP